MGRVEITGQFNVDFAACSSSSGPFQVERHPSSISTTSIRNWNGFCDSVDQALAPLTKIKAVAKISSFVFYVVAALYFFGMFLLPWMLDFDDDFLRYPGVVIIVSIFAVYAIIWLLYIRGGLNAGMEKVKGICEQYSTISGGVKYKLESEHWGGCNKPHVKRWYIIVDVDEEANATNVAEQQKDTTDDTTSDYFSTQGTSSAQQETAPPVAVPTPYYSTTTQEETVVPMADATPSNRLADMLK